MKNFFSRKVVIEGMPFITTFLTSSTIKTPELNSFVQLTQNDLKICKGSTKKEWRADFVPLYTSII